jgi:hypothetical protein
MRDCKYRRTWVNKAVESTLGGRGMRERRKVGRDEVGVVAGDGT